MLSERMRKEVERCRNLYGGVEEYDAYSMDAWIDAVAKLEAVARAAKSLEMLLDALGARESLRHAGPDLETLTEALQKAEGLY